MKILNKISFVLLAIYFIAFCESNSYASASAKLVIKVADEEGKPISDANLKIRFSSNRSVDRGVTDANGIFQKSTISNDGVVLGDVTKSGYYESGLAHSFYVSRFGKWQPWGKEITVVMRPIVNPVPMYVRNSSFQVPIFGEEIGFDLEKADWVIPHGTGTHSDFIFKVDQVYDNGDNYDARMTLSFSNLFDGIQVVQDDGGGDFNIGSAFRLPRTAPDTGYLSVLKRRNSRGTFGRFVDREESNNYIFRVRSESDENGKLKQAMYGKIRGEIWYAPGGGGRIWMHYYLNPEYTPNLEFDPKRNLFRGLLPNERTGFP
jgi:hypothetical protein